MSVCVCVCVSERVSEWGLGERASEWVSERAYVCVSAWVGGWVGE